MATAVPVPQQPPVQQQPQQAAPMPTQQPGGPAAPAVHAAKQATQTLAKAATSLPQMVGQQVQQHDQHAKIRMQHVINTVANAHIADTAARTKVQQLDAIKKQIDQHWQEAQALPDSDPQKHGKLQYLAMLHKQVVQGIVENAQTIKQHQQVTQAILAEPKNRKILAKAVGYDEKAANTPERQMMVQALQQHEQQIQQAAQQADQAPQHTSVMHKLGTIAKTVGEIAAPEVAMLIPGSAANQEMHARKMAYLQEQQMKMQGQQATIDQKEGQAQEALAKHGDAQAKVQADREKTQAQLKAKEDQIAFLRERMNSPSAAKGKTGVLFDQSVPYGWTSPDGKQYTASDPDMPEQGKRALRDANAAYKKYVSMKTQTGTAAKERADAYWGNYLLHSQGVDMQHHPLPGAMQTDQGAPIGSSLQSNVRPTGTERSRADLASSAKDQMASMEKLLTTRKDLFGPSAGRKTDLTVWLGSQDPDAAAFKASARIVADHLAGVFGGRSEAALEGIYKVIGENKTNPRAAIAALNKMNEAATIIMKRGTVHTVGGNNSESKAKPGTPTADDPLGIL